VGDAISAAMYNRSRFREAAAVAAIALSVGEDYRLLHALARAEEVLGEASAALVHYQRALALCPAGDALPAAVVRERGSILHNTAILCVRQGDLGSAVALCRLSLAAKEQTGDDVGTAATLHVLADIHRQRGELDDALGLCERAVRICETRRDARGKAATLHQMAGIHERRGDPEQALAFYQQCLPIQERIGDALGMAATLHNMALINEQRGDVRGGLALYEQSLRISEEIGDAHGKAATLAGMAATAWRRGDTMAAQTYSAQAASILVAARAWPDAVTVIGNLSEYDSGRAQTYLAQTLWLALRAEAQLQQTILTAGHLQQDLGSDQAVAPLLATTAMYFVTRRGEKHVEREELEGVAWGMLGACAEARGIAAEDIPAWVERERLNDADYFLPALSRALEEMVGEDEWLFDRTQVPRPEWDA